MPAVLELRDDGDLWSDALALRNAPERFALDKPRSRSLKKVVEGSPRSRAYRRDFARGVGQDLWDAAAGLVMLLAIAMPGSRRRPGSSSRAARQLTIGCQARALGHPAVRSCCEEPTGCAAARRVQITSASFPSFSASARTASHVRTDYPHAMSKRFELTRPAKGSVLASMAIMVDAMRCAHTLSPSVEVAPCSAPWCAHVQFLISGMSSP
jgi:hypothetical protein